MGLYSKPVSSWDGEDVCAWLVTLNLTQLVPAFRGNHVTGQDLFSLTLDDLTGSSFGCTSFQASKVVGEVSKLLGKPAPSAPPAPFYDSAIAPQPAPAYPPSPFSGQAEDSLQHTVPPTPSIQPMQSQLTPASSAAPPAPAARSSEVELLRLELEQERQRNNMRYEMDMRARVAATEAAQRASSAPVVVNNTHHSGAPPPVYEAPTFAPPTHAYHYFPTEKYCGPISWVIGICLLPCIFMCPVDERPVYGATPMVAAPATSGVVYTAHAPPVQMVPMHSTNTKPAPMPDYTGTAAQA